jgi:outer membrane lipoprotein SlyB
LKRSHLLFVALIVVFFAACSTERPIVYPNTHLEKVGHETYELDYQACLELSAQHVEGAGAGSEIAQKTAKGAVIGGASGAARGAVRGDAGATAGANAAGRAVSGFLNGVFSSGGPDPAVKRFVERCMRDKGYDVIGWGKG